MADNTRFFKKDVPPDSQGIRVDQLLKMAESQRKGFERRWYDNNFFDDGYHFRYVSRTTGKIIDLGGGSGVDMPMRAIPKASRQIRGVANLLLAPEYKPVIYPDEINKREFEDPVMFEAEVQRVKDEASKIGFWLQDNWEDLNLKDQLTQMLILSAKNSVSYLKIWGDTEKEQIKISPRDAFDLFLIGSYNEIEESPFIIDTKPRPIEEVINDERFDKEKRAGLTEDNKYATSEVKEAYMRTKFGSGNVADKAGTIIQKEAFIKEILTDKNREEVMKLSKDANWLKERKNGDTIMRHTFSAGGITLLDEYIHLTEYPFVDFRFEPGPIYQVPLIERFIPANKSLDIAMSRIERYLNTMVTGTWLQRDGEDFQINNIAGGQKITYKGTPPVQGQMANIPSFVFNYISQINQIIEEQGASTAALGNLPEGVKSGVAIESVKAIEYANLKIPGDQLKKTVKAIAHKMITIGSDFIFPQNISMLENNQTVSFNIMGEEGVKKRREIGEDIPENTIVLSKDRKIDIEVESGLGFTQEGKKQTMQQIIDYMQVLMQQGLVTQEAVQVVTNRFLEIFQFGSTAEFMQAMESGTQASPITEDQVDQIKIAVAEVMQDLGIAGQEAEEKQIDTTKTGVLEAINDLQ